MNIEIEYLNLLKTVLHDGTPSEDRTGTGTRSVFGAMLRHDLQKGFPLLTTKKVFFKGVKAELYWFLRGYTNVQYLHEWGTRIWDEWADEQGDLGPIYGAQWRDWNGEGRDQLRDVIEGIKANPYSRRHIVSAWNVSQLNDMALVPCHYAFQLYVRDGKLSLMWQQRSCDLFLGGPFNIASYALLTHLIAQECGLDVGELVWSIGDAHIYNNHVNQVREQLRRSARRLPTLDLDSWIESVDAFLPDNARVVEYNPHPAIKAPIAV